MGGVGTKTYSAALHVRSRNRRRLFLAVSRGTLLKIGFSHLHPDDGQPNESREEIKSRECMPAVHPTRYIRPSAFISALLIADPALAPSAAAMITN